jgi:hypothetical protein
VVNPSISTRNRPTTSAARHAESNSPAVNPNPLEKVIERKLSEYVKAQGGHTRKWSSPANTGVPDRIVVMPGGAVGFLELKRKGNVPTPKQHHEMALLRKQGANVWWSDTLQDACKFVDMLVLVGRGKVKGPINSDTYDEGWKPKTEEDFFA